MSVINGKTNAERFADIRERRGLPAHQAISQQQNTRTPIPPVRPSIKTEKNAALNAVSPCIYRGEKTGESTCSSCARKEQISVLRCGIHERCTLSKLSDDRTIRRCCRTCKDRVAPTDSVVIPGRLSVQEAIALNTANPGGWSVAITTAPREPHYLDDCIGALLRGGWSDPYIFAEPETDLGPLARAVGKIVMRPQKLGGWLNTREAIAFIAGNNADAYMLLQDDTLIAPNTRKLVENTWPHPIFSLYTSGEYVNRVSNGWTIRPTWAWGSCAIVFDQKTIRDFVQTARFKNHHLRPRGRKGKDSDQVIGHYIGRSGTQMGIACPTPSLAQHVGETSLIRPGQNLTWQRKSTCFVGFNFDPDKLLFTKPLATGANDAVTLITPTGDRPESFRLLEFYMRRQTFKGRVQWIIVDDGATPTQVNSRKWDNTLHLRRESDQSLPSLNQNLLAALEHVEHQKVLIIEDDDYYGPDYIAQMVDSLNHADLAGETNGRYWDVRTAKAWRPGRTRWSSLCRTGFTRKAIDTFIEACRRNSYSIDDYLWRTFKGKKHQPMDVPARAACVSIKGMPGRKGYTWNARRKWREGNLEAWLGNDYNIYDVGTVAVFTVLIGKYDRVRPPKRTNPLVPHFLLTDQHDLHVDGWITLPVASDHFDHPTRASRFYKILSHANFRNTDWTIYHDANMRQAVDPYDYIRGLREKYGEADIYLPQHEWDCVYREAREVERLSLAPADRLAAQVAKYRVDHPEHWGCYQCRLMVRRSSDKITQFESQWWADVNEFTFRDQVSFPYAARTHGLTIGAMPHGSHHGYGDIMRHLSSRPRFTAPVGV